MRRQRVKQLELPLKLRGGKRRTAGRKRKSVRRRVPHSARVPLSSSTPVHVTVTLCEGLPPLRRQGTRKILNRAFAAGRERFGFRLIHFSIQSNHLHLLAEARDRKALGRGIQGLTVRISRNLNRLWKRKGQVFWDRYHDRVLSTPREVRNALVYVLQNAKKHGARLLGKLDAFASGCWFDGWKRRPRFAGLLPDQVAVAPARSWLLKEGWRRHGLIDPSESPRRSG